MSSTKPRPADKKLIKKVIVAYDAEVAYLTQLRKKINSLLKNKRIAERRAEAVQALQDAEHLHDEEGWNDRTGWEEFLLDVSMIYLIDRSDDCDDLIKMIERHQSKIGKFYEQLSREFEQSYYPRHIGKKFKLVKGIKDCDVAHTLKSYDPETKYCELELPDGTVRRLFASRLQAVVADEEELTIASCDG